MLDKKHLLKFMAEVGTTAEGPGTIYVVGGASALLLDIRTQTVDIDIKLEPEPKGVFERIAILKERLDINVEIASPDQFVPPLPGWRERSQFIAKYGLVDFYHYDFYGQTLAKILRGHEKDIADVQAFLDLGKVNPSKLQELFDDIQGQLIRYPAISAPLLRRRVKQFVDAHTPESPDHEPI